MRSKEEAHDYRYFPRSRPAAAGIQPGRMSMELQVAASGTARQKKSRFIAAFGLFAL